MSENYFDKLRKSDPSHRVVTTEFTHSFLSICTMVCQLNNKKLNLAKIFITLLQDSTLRGIFMELTSIETEFDLLKKFLEHDQTLHKSKYIKSYITSCRKPLK